MAEEAWGRWGQDDQLGGLNSIGADEVRTATALVRHGKVIGLSQPLSSTMPVPPHRQRPAHFMTRDGGDYAAGARRPDAFQFADDMIVLPLHAGTHIDCLCHVWYEDKLYNGFSGNTVRSSGALRLGAETLKPIVTRGVLIDLVAVAGRPLNGGESVGRVFVEEACRRAGITVRRGDAVLLRTGWYEAHAQAAQADFNTEPGIDVEAALFLADAGAALVGADNYAIEVLPFPEGTVFPVHKRLIRDYGVLLLEGLVLKPLAEAGATEFLFVAAALPIVGATASPLTPVAVL